jgi:prepilin-type N-terminal cleavage/methylation domain-containing protein
MLWTHRNYNAWVMSRLRRRCTLGTTLVELMIVVVILGILAALASVGYKRYVGRARLSEAHAMLAELSAKEQLYFMDTGAYVPARAAASNPLVQPSPDEDAAAFLPIALTAADFESARTAHAISTMPTAWSRIGLKPQWPALYCSYLVNAGGAGQDPPAGIGAHLWAATPAVPWFYAVAACNLNTTGDESIPTGYPANATFMVLTYDSPGIRTLNDDQ